MKYLICLLTALLLTSCGQQEEGSLSTGPGQLPSETVKHRWYTQKQVNTGQVIFNEHCLVCHGADGKGTVQDWQTPLSNGKYPPPPLNGSAHTWHHDLPVLRRVITEGGQRLGGTMPAMGGVLTETEIDNILAYITSLWPDEVYQRWASRFGYEKN
ncbi:MAG TPA: cytochrome C oxidase Cbb3 [Porticoccaceae bacterium]|nr:cytochrome C oxidase Cbb3 [Porticoccaceae bacterium]